MRKAFGKFITELARYDEDVYLIIGDTGYGIFDEFIEEFPDRFINVGLCEQTMISMAAGMALKGLKPWVYAITPFLIERPYEQIKVDICCNKANVKLVGYDDYPDLGPTHQCAEIGHLMASLYDIEYYTPYNSKDTIECLDYMYDTKLPCFIHLRRDNDR